jgi:hypothetical protein
MDFGRLNQGVIFESQSDSPRDKVKHSSTGDRVYEEQGGVVRRVRIHF